MQSYIQVILIILGFLLFAFILAWIAVKMDDLSTQKHLDFLSERIGHKVLSIKEWCEKNDINYSKYWDDKTVKDKYRNYILNIETNIMLKG